MTSDSRRRPIVAGNWKMHGSRAENRTLIEGLVTSASVDESATCIVCPPFVYLGDVARELAGSAIRLGAQDVCAENSGAYTGEVAASMLKDVGCTYVIVGHSERRALYGESDELVARKFAAAQARGLVPILCVGELLAERDAGRTHEVVGRQLDAVIALRGIAALGNAVVAYEPVWAIGTGRTATPEQAQDVHAFIRGRVAAHDANIATGLAVLYGGSVKAGNARELFAMPDVDGGLIGGASLKAEEFLAIWSAAAAH
ncbi:MAG: triose-phosphate isomerase [Steroidobacteraceae bacterium]